MGERILSIAATDKADQSTVAERSRRRGPVGAVAACVVLAFAGAAQVESAPPAAATASASANCLGVDRSSYENGVDLGQGIAAQLAYEHAVGANSFGPSLAVNARTNCSAP